MNVSEFIDPSFSVLLIAAFMHFLWQGCLVALLAILGDRLLSQSTANRRYALHVAVMGIMVACVPITYMQMDLPTTVTTAPSKSVGSEDSPTMGDSDLLPESVSPGESMAIELGMEPVLPADEELDLAATSFAGSSDFSGLGSSNPEPSRLVDVSESEEPMVHGDGLAAANGDAARQMWPWAPLVAMLYFACCGLLLARLLHGAWGTQRLRHAATHARDDSLENSLQQQSHVLGLRVLPRIAWCVEVSIPLVIGVVRPLILIPSAAATGLSPEQLQVLITHELAHIRRYDLWVNLIQRVVESMLFFHPAVWYVALVVNANKRVTNWYCRRDANDSATRMHWFAWQSFRRRCATRGNPFQQLRWRHPVAIHPNSNAECSKCCQSQPQRICDPVVSLC